MKKENLKKANDLEDQIEKLEATLSQWKRSISFYHSVPCVQLKIYCNDSNISSTTDYSVSFYGIPFEVIKACSMHFLQEKIKSLEKEFAALD